MAGHESLKLFKWSFCRQISKFDRVVRAQTIYRCLNSE